MKKQVVFATSFGHKHPLVPKARLLETYAARIGHVNLLTHNYPSAGQTARVNFPRTFRKCSCANGNASLTRTRKKKKKADA